MAIDLAAFQGRVPYLHPHDLGDMQAQVARNCRFDGGRLRALKNSTPHAALVTGPAVKTLFRYTSSFWFEWDEDVHALRPPIAKDAYDRVYFTGNFEPRVTYNSVATSGSGPYPSNWQKIGIPAPTSTVTATVAGTADDADSDPVTRFYTVTYVNNFGEEGPPAGASNEVEWRDGQSVDITGIPGAPTGSWNITHARIYRSENDTGYYYVGQVTIGTTSFSDTVATTDLGDALLTQEFDPPPDDMEGLIQHPNEWLIGFRGNQLLFSEPGYAYAWPVRYRKTINDQIVGLAIVDNAVLVLTDERPYVAAGSHPGNLSVEAIDGLHQACVSSRSIVDLGNSVAFASPDGLVLVTPEGSDVVTRHVFTREQWGALKPSSMTGYLWEGAYLCFYDKGDGTGQQCFVLAPGTPEAGVVDIDVTATAGFMDHEADTLYLARDASATTAGAWAASTAYSVGDVRIPSTANDRVYECTTAGTSGSTEPTWPTTNGATVTDGTVTWTCRTQLIEAWDQGSALTYTWKSRPFLHPALVNYSVARLTADAYSVNLKIFTSDDVKRISKDIVNASPTRLSAAYRDREVTVQLSGTKDVSRCVLARGMTDMPA